MTRFSFVFLICIDCCGMLYVCRDLMRRMESKLSDLVSWLHFSFGGRQVVCMTSDPLNSNAINRTFSINSSLSVSLFLTLSLSVSLSLFTASDCLKTALAVDIMLLLHFYCCWLLTVFSYENNRPNTRLEAVDQ